MERRRASTISYVFLGILVLSILLEGALLFWRTRSMPAYEPQEVAVEEMTSEEFESLGDNQFEAMAYNSYFTAVLPTPGPVQQADVLMTRSSDDPTETVLYAKGVKNGVEGTFVFPLALVEEGRYRAVLEMERVDTLQVFPTEKVHTRLSFEGVSVNNQVERPALSVSEMVLFFTGLSFLLFLFVYIRARVKKTTPLTPWVVTATGASFGACAVAFAAGRMFTAARQLTGWLPIAGALLGFFFVCFLYVVTHFGDFAWKAGAIALVLGVLFCFANAPLQAPDEYTHFFRAYSVSRGKLGFDNTLDYPEDMDLLTQTFGGEFYNYIIIPGKGNALTEIQRYEAARKAGEQVERDYETHIQILLPYVASGLGVALARLFSSDPLVWMYAGRLMNVVLYVMAFTFALRRAKRYRLMVLLTGFWPLTIYTCSSFSYDALFHCLLLCLLGFLFSEASDRMTLLGMALCFGGMVSIKPTTLALLPIFFLLSDAGVRRKALPLGAGCGLVLYGLALGYAALFSNGMPGEELLPGVDVRAQVLYVLSHPVRYLMILLVDGYQNGFYLGNSGLFGWLDVKTVLTTILAPVLVVVVSFLEQPLSERKDRRRDFWASAVTVALFYAVVVTGFYCQCSTLGSTSILGVQARYFIPMLPCIGIVLVNGLARGKVSIQGEQTGKEELALWLCGATGLLAGAEIFLMYFLT